jgi:hypothetical protein
MWFGAEDVNLVQDPTAGSGARNATIWKTAGTGKSVERVLGNLTIEESDVSDLSSLSTSITLSDNISGDPLFIDFNGADNILGNEDDNFRIESASPCKDNGDQTLRLEDYGDLNNDLNFTEATPRDLDLNERVIGSEIDMGTYERTGDVPCPALIVDTTPGRTRHIGLTSTHSSNTNLRVTMIELDNPIPPNNNPAGPCCPPGNFITFDTAVNSVCAGGNNQGYRCTSDCDCPGSTCPAPVGCTATGEGNACTRWVGAPFGYLESNDNPGLGNYKAARLQCSQPTARDWSADGLINITGAEIVPSSKYLVEVIPCSPTECATTVCAVYVQTARAGDISTPIQGAPPLTQPNAMDVTNAVNKFMNLAGSPPKGISQVQPNAPDPNADFNAIDLVTVVDHQRGFGYTYSGPCACPSTVPCNVTPCESASTTCTAPYGAGATCVKTCTAGRVGEPCTNNLSCGTCIGGPASGQGAAGIPCDANGDCASGNCAVGVCPTGAAPGFCRDRCRRCCGSCVGGQTPGGPCRPYNPPTQPIDYCVSGTCNTAGCP